MILGKVTQWTVLLGITRRTNNRGGRKTIASAGLTNINQLFQFKRLGLPKNICDKTNCNSKEVPILHRYFCCFTYDKNLSRMVVQLKSCSEHNLQSSAVDIYFLNRLDLTIFKYGDGMDFFQQNSLFWCY